MAPLIRPILTQQSVCPIFCLPLGTTQATRKPYRKPEKPSSFDAGAADKSGINQLKVMCRSVRGRLSRAAHFLSSSYSQQCPPSFIYHPVYPFRSRSRLSTRVHQPASSAVLGCFPTPLFMLRAPRTRLQKPGSAPGIHRSMAHWTPGASELVK